jgi:hypothetical protein
MDRMLELILKFIKLPLHIIILISVTLGVVLFLPDALLAKLKLIDFVNDYGKYLGLPFLLSIGYSIMTLVYLYIKWRKNIKARKKAIEKTLQDLNKVTYQEKILLREFTLQRKDVIEVPLTNAAYIMLEE